MKRQIQIARAMFALTVGDAALQAPHPETDQFEPKRLNPRSVNYKLKAKNRARRKEANRQNKRRRNAA